MRRVRPLALAAVLSSLAALGGLVACSSGSDTQDDLVQSVVVIELRSGSGLRGLTLTLTHVADASIAGIQADDLSVGSCQANVGSTSVVAACATTTDFSAPLDAWRITLAHPSSTDALDAITSLQCAGSDATGNPRAVTCGAVLGP